MQRSLITNSIKAGDVGVLPTDTLYGIVASALNRASVERLYKLKGRTPTKPCIILIAAVEDLSLFGISLDSQTRTLINSLWPGPVSIILPLRHDDISNNVIMFKYLHRGTNTLAFRLPDDAELRELLVETGPLVAPSANPESLPPAATADEARNYFHDRVDFYVDAREHAGKPSTLVAIENGKVVVLRQGAGVVPKEILTA